MTQHRPIQFVDPWWKLRAERRMVLHLAIALKASTSKHDLLAMYAAELAICLSYLNPINLAIIIHDQLLSHRFPHDVNAIMLANVIK